MIAEMKQKAKSWMLEAFFPFWAANGIDQRIGFAENLTFDGKRFVEDVSRVRVQARQTYCFALAYQMAWDRKKSRELALFGADTLLTHCRRPDGLFGRMMSYQGGLADDDADLYDNAFCLFALSFAAYALDDANLRQAALSLHDAFQSNLRRPEHEGGYREFLPTPAIRLQNPHMHTMEAYQRLATLTQDPNHGKMTCDAEAYVAQHYVHPETGYLHEELNEDGSEPSSDRFEAGHQYEWVWLLTAQSRIGQSVNKEMASSLYAAAQELTNADGRIHLSHKLDKSPLDPVHRTWIQTEALKGHLSQIPTAEGLAIKGAQRAFELLFEDHLLPDGGWIDRRNPDLNPVHAPMTAATGYHVALAFIELINFADEA